MAVAGQIRWSPAARSVGDEGWGDTRVRGEIGGVVEVGGSSALRPAVACIDRRGSAMRMGVQWVMAAAWVLESSTTPQRRC
jgi:hypothetical protein